MLIFFFFFFFISILDADLISPTRKDHINQIKHFVTRTKKEKDKTSSIALLVEGIGVHIAWRGEMDVYPVLLREYTVPRCLACEEVVAYLSLSYMHPL